MGRLQDGAPPFIPAIGDEKGCSEEPQGEQVPPQQVQEPGIICLVHSGKRGTSDSLSPQPEQGPPNSPWAGMGLGVGQEAHLKYRNRKE